MATKILLVEDEEENQLLGLTVLKPLGVEVLVADNGREALALAAEKLPDLILLDIIMPGMTGLEVLERLKADAKTKDIPVMMLTSRQVVEEFRRAQELGAKGFLNKPYDIDAFLSRVCLELGLPVPKAS
jgi:CheY-like chemotaxis protein